MQVTPIVLGASGSARIALGGNYFRLLAATNPVTVRLYRKGRPFSEALGMLTGYWSAPTEGFEEVEIITGLAQTVAIGTVVGIGGYDRSAGDVNISGLTAGVVLAAAEQGFSYGASFQSMAALVINASETQFAAGSNTNGAQIWTAESWDQFSGATMGMQRYQAHTSIPNSMTTGDQLAQANMFIHLGAANTIAWFSSVKRTKLAANKGFYITAQQSMSAGYRIALYTLN